MGIQRYVSQQGKISYRVNVYNRLTGKTQWVGTFDRRGDADLALADSKRKLRLGEPLMGRRDIGFSDLVAKWLETLTVRDSTRTDYEAARRHLVAFFGNRPVSSLTREDVQQFVAWAVRKRFSDNYVRKLTTRLSQILNVAVEWGYIGASPAAGRIRNLPKQPARRVIPLTDEEVRALIAAAPEYWKPLFLVMVGCGLRRGEVFGLTWSDIDLKDGTLTVRRQLVGESLVEPKSAKAKRSIPIPASVLAALRIHRLACPRSEFDLVFPTEAGFPVNPSNFYSRVFRPAVREAGVREDLKLHDLRKTFASALVRQGRSAAFFASVMGHSSPTTTLSYYVGVFADETRPAADDLDRWLTGANRSIAIA